MRLFRIALVTRLVTAIMTGGLSNRVLNMKFMKSNENSQPEELSVNKIVDTSQWSLKDSGKLVDVYKPKTELVGYGSIHSFDDDKPVISKRLWGVNDKDKIADNSLTINNFEKVCFINTSEELLLTK